MNSDTIKACVANYYRYQRQCPIVALEAWNYHYPPNQPDVLVVDVKNRLIEVEVKVSLSDFKADRKKKIWQVREMNPNEWPWQVYFAVPDVLVEKVQPVLPEGCGLLEVSSKWHEMYLLERAVKCVVKAPTHKGKAKLSDHYLQTIIAAQSATLCRTLARLTRAKSNGKGEI